MFNQSPLIAKLLMQAFENISEVHIKMHLTGVASKVAFELAVKIIVSVFPFLHYLRSHREQSQD